MLIQLRLMNHAGRIKIGSVDFRTGIPGQIPEIPFPEPRILCTTDLSMPYFSGGNNVLFSTTLSKDTHSTRSSCHVLRTAIQWFPELFSCGIFRNFLFLFSSVWFGSFRLGQFSSVQFRSGQVRLRLSIKVYSIFLFSNGNF